MQNACATVRSIASVQIRDLAAPVHELLKKRAADAGMSLSEYLRVELERLAATPTMDELIERIKERGLYHFEQSSADLIREEREARDRQLDRR